MSMLPDAAAIKQIIIATWAVWLSLVTIMNVCEALVAVRLLPKDFKFASSNWTLMLNVTSIYNTPRWLVAAMFAGVILWEAVATLLLWVALASRSPALADAGFGLLIALWGSFLVMSQFFRSFVVAPAIPEAHRSIFGICLLSLVALHVL